MGQIAIPSSTASSASNTVKYLKVGTSGGTIYMGEVRVFPSDEDVSSMTLKALTLVAWEDTTFTFTPSSSQTLSYSTDDETTWSTLPSTGIAVSAGQEVRFSGACVPVASSSTVTAETNWGIGRFSSTGKYHVEGNVMSLLGSGWATNKSLQGKSWAFFGLFSGSTTLMSAEHLSLPATTLYSYCYRHMFVNCTNLTMGPELPSLGMYTQCYYGMFQGCSKLVTTPKLPSTTLADSCYMRMFSGCTSLLTTTDLPATTLAVSCYYEMFDGCKNITKAPKLPALTLPNNAYREMFTNCSALTEAPELPATTLGTYCYSYTFYGCTSLKTFPGDLPAKTLTNGCYRYMFGGCKNLEKAPDILATSSVVTSAMTYMFQTCSKLNRIKCLVTGITTSNGISGFTSGVAASGTFIKDANMTGWTTGANGIPTGWTVKNSYGDVKYPLTFIARENCTFTFSGSSAYTTGALSYSTDSGTTWNPINGQTTSVTVSSGNIVQWMGTCVAASGNLADSGIGRFSSNGNFDVEGNIMSLMFNDFSGQTSLSGKGRAFTYLFNENTNVINAENLMLPATTLTSYCYHGMFARCSSLINAPELPATSISSASDCYGGMFMYCSSLTKAPELPALSIPTSGYQYMFSACTSLVETPELPGTTLRNFCYRFMFGGCTSLTKAPDLLVKTVSQQQAYYRMFDGCTNLKYIKCLATDISGTDCTGLWVRNVASQGTFVKDPEMTGWTRTTSGIPTTWKDSDYLTFVALEDDVKFRFNYPIAKESTNKLSYSLDGGETWTEIASTIYTPPLKKGEKIRWKGTCEPTTTNGIGTFESFGNFNVEGNVMSLLFGDDYVTQVNLTGKDYAFYNLFYDCTTLVNAEYMILPATTLSTRCYSQMFYGCTSLTMAPELPEATLANACYRSMFNRCSSLVKAPSVIKSATNTMATSACTYMFYLCSSLTTAPDLPTTTLANHCYKYMFSGCTSLNYIKAMFTTTPSTSYTQNWVSSVASSGTFVKNSTATWDVTGVNGIPTGWTVQTETP